MSYDVQLKIPDLNAFCTALNNSIKRLTELKGNLDTVHADILDACEGETQTAIDSSGKTLLEDLKSTIDDFTDYKGTLSTQVKNAATDLAHDANIAGSKLGSAFGGWGKGGEASVVSIKYDAMQSAQTDIITLKSKFDAHIGNISSLTDTLNIPDREGVRDYCINALIDMPMCLTTYNDHMEMQKELLESFSNALSNYETNILTFEKTVPTWMEKYTKLRPKEFKSGSINMVKLFDALQAAIVEELYSKYERDGSWKETLQKEPDKISDAEYMALAYLFLDTTDAETKEEFLNACLTKTGDSLQLDKDAQQRFARISQSAQSIYMVESAMVDQAFAKYGAEDAACIALWTQVDKHYQNWGLLQTCSLLADKRIGEARKPASNYLGDPAYDNWEPTAANFSIQLKDFKATDDPTKYQATLTFSERGGATTYKATVSDYWNPAALGDCLKGEVNEQITDLTGADPNGEVAKKIGDKVIDQIKGKALEEMLGKVAKEGLEKATGPVSFVVDLAQTYDETVRLNQQGKKMITNNNMSHAAKDLSASGMYIKVERTTSIRRPFEDKKQPYITPQCYMRPTYWDMGQDITPSQDMLDDEHYHLLHDADESGADFSSFDEALQHAIGCDNTGESGECVNRSKGE